MKKPSKNLLIYADGRVEEAKQDLVGDRFIQSVEKPDGSLWEREFQCQVAYEPSDEPWETRAYTLVGLERRFFERYSAEEWSRMRAKWREESLDRVLRAIMTAPERD